jgi:hypothetical protein
MESYVNFNKEVSSEMFCSVMTCFHHHLPCTGVIVQLKNAFRGPQVSDQKSNASNTNHSLLASPGLMRSVEKHLGSPMTPANESLLMKEKKMQKLASKMESFKAKKGGGVKLNLAKKTGKLL